LFQIHSVNARPAHLLARRSRPLSGL
jgi:hypothetical protein